MVLSPGNIVAFDEKRLISSCKDVFYPDYNGNHVFSCKELGNTQRRGCVRAESLSILMLCRCEIGECQSLNVAAFKAVTKRWQALCFVPSLSAPGP